MKKLVLLLGVVGVLGAFAFLFVDLRWPQDAEPVVAAPVTFLNSPKVASTVEEKPAPGGVMGAIATVTNTAKKTVATVQGAAQGAGIVLGASTDTTEQRTIKYVTRNKGSKKVHEDKQQAPVLTVRGCSGSGCELGSGTVVVSWSATPGAGSYELYVDGAVVETTEGTTHTLTLAEGSHTIQVIAIHGQSGNGAGFASSEITITINVPDTTPPTIAAHDDVSVEATSTLSTGAEVAYSAPTATDDEDGAVAVSCSPASGSTFAVGTTTVTCSASDAAGNEAQSTFAVGVYLPADTTPPTIAAHEDISVEAASAEATGAEVTYTAPTATDDTDGVVAVSCSPASGTTFAVGTTTVTCSAEDAAGNEAQSTFAVGVYLPAEPEPEAGVVFTFDDASQPDESVFCDQGWESCYNGGDTQRFALGSGADLQGGALHSLTLSLDPTYASQISPWRVTINCYTDVGLTVQCTDWAQGILPNLVTQLATTSDDGKHWTAYFTTDRSFAGGDLTFTPAYYYELQIDANGQGIPLYGSATRPYWLLKGVTI